MNDTVPSPFGLEELEKTARQANLGLSQKRLARFVPQLAHLLTQVETLSTLQEPGLPPQSLAAPVEPDEPLPGLPREEALSSAKMEGPYVRVPRILASRSGK